MHVHKLARIQFHQPQRHAQTTVLAAAATTTIIYDPGAARLTLKTAEGESHYEVLPNYQLSIHVELAEMPDGF